MYKVIGNGMIAKAFINLSTPPLNTIIFASGVSDSGCIDNNKFIREKKLLINELKKANNNSRFIYFSTCSIYDKQLMDSPYVNHKKSMEEMILNSNKGYVFRLAQIAGKDSPSKTLLTSIQNAALTGEIFQIWTKAKRNILDVIDARDIIIKLMERDNLFSNCINIANPRQHSIKDLVLTFENVLGTKINKIYIDKGCGYDIDITGTEELIQGLKINEDNYLERIIRKYYS